MEISAMKKLFIASAFASLALLSNGPAVSATLANLQGQVLVNGVPATEGQTVAAGDVVTIGEQGGQASIVLAEGCSLTASLGQVVTVPASFQCPPPVAGGINPSQAAIATGLGVLAGGGIGYAVGDDNNDDKPASP
jgi:ribosome-associated protein YbcJ (S4-like RNA binding protein)